MDRKYNYSTEWREFITYILQRVINNDVEICHWSFSTVYEEIEASVFRDTYVKQEVESLDEFMKLANDNAKVTVSTDGKAWVNGRLLTGILLKFHAPAFQKPKNIKDNLLPVLLNKSDLILIIISLLSICGLVYFFVFQE